MDKIKILIVDDHLIVIEGLKLIFETEDDYEIIGEAKNGEEALFLTGSLKPDVILMDLSMPKMNGLEVIKALNERGNKAPIIILTTYNENNLIKEGLSLGVKGYLTKDATREELKRTIKSAIRGEILLQPEISKNLFELKNQTNKINNLIETQLTERELFVLQAIARGCKIKEISFDMGISERTVKSHLTNIYTKLNVESRTEAVALAVEQGLIHVQK